MRCGRGTFVSRSFAAGNQFHSGPADRRRPSTRSSESAIDRGYVRPVDLLVDHIHEGQDSRKDPTVRASYSSGITGGAGNAAISQRPPKDTQLPTIYPITYTTISQNSQGASQDCTTGDTAEHQEGRPSTNGAIGYGCQQPVAVQPTHDCIDVDEIFGLGEGGFPADAAGIPLEYLPIGGIAKRGLTSVAHLLKGGWPRKLGTKPSNSWHWPLYMPDVPSAKTAEIVSLSENPRLKYLWAQFAVLPAPGVEDEERLQSSLAPNDIEVLKKCPFIRLAPEGTRVTAVAFSVDEPNKCPPRRRFIVWPKRLNDRLGKTAAFSLLSVEEVIQQTVQALKVTPELWALLADLKAAFFQHHIPEQLVSWVTFRVEDQVFQILALPMGFVSSPEFQQLISTACTRFLRVQAGNIHIDNFRWLASRNELTIASGVLHWIAERFQLTWSDPPAMCRQFEYLGMTFDLQNRTVKVGQKTIKKIRALPVTTVMHWQTYVSIMGMLFFATAVLRLHLASYYYCLKQFRSFAAFPTEHITLWKQAEEELRSWRDEVLREHPRSLESNPMATRFVLFTDASDTGFAMLLFAEAKPVQLYARKWTQERWWQDERYLPPIAQRELYPVKRSLTWLHES